MNKLIKQAFTLIELLVVIAIVGILSGLVIITMSGATQRATIAKAQVFNNSLRNSIMLNMVSDWSFDGSGVSDGSLSTAEYLIDTWGQQNGTVTSYPPTVLSGNSCVSGSCLNFDGSTQYVSIPYNSVFNFGSAMTAMVWVKGGAQDTKYILNQVNLSTNVSWAITTTAGSFDSSINKFRVIVSDNGTFSSGHRKQYYANNIVFDNNWHLIGFTWNSGDLILYVDGVVASITKYANDAITSIYNSSTNLLIGCDLTNNSPTNYFTGQIDEARLYNVAIPISQIKKQYYAGLNSLLASGNITNEEYRQGLDLLVNK
jgi:prepilin-type N-terminal cleavage/methylation domain-containing protein